MDVTETSEATVDGVGGEEGDVDILKDQKLGELQHGHNMRGHWKREDQHVRLCH